MHRRCWPHGVGLYIWLCHASFLPLARTKQRAPSASTVGKHNTRVVMVFKDIMPRGCDMGAAHFWCSTSHSAPELPVHHRNRCVLLSPPLPYSTSLVLIDKGHDSTNACHEDGCLHGPLPARIHTATAAALSSKGLGCIASVLLTLLLYTGY